MNVRIAVELSGVEREACALGRRAPRTYAAAQAIAALPSAKRRRLRALLREHRSETTIVLVEAGLEDILARIAAESTPGERAELLARVRDGTLRAVGLRRALAEGIDVPGASVAIVVTIEGAARADVERVGATLQAPPGKSARVYELVTLDRGAGGEPAQAAALAAGGCS